MESSFSHTIQLPRRVQDSSLVACPNGVWTPLLILTGTSKWITIFVQIGGLTTLLIGTGAPGFEVPEFDLVMPGVVAYMNAINQPFEFPIGTRIAAHPNAIGCSVELHVSY